MNPGADLGKAPPLRRYLGAYTNEPSAPRQPVRPDVAKLFRDTGIVQGPSFHSVQHPNIPPDIAEATARRMSQTFSDMRRLDALEKGWSSTHHNVASVDNKIINPHLRHYFDTRGLEASYRERPGIDKGMPMLPSRVQQGQINNGRPTTREKILRHYSSEGANSLLEKAYGSKVKRKTKADAPPKIEVDAGKRGEGSIPWGRRCLTYGADHNRRQTADGSKMPWVSDHHRSETEDNHLVNPLLRHYFDADGLESSFRLRERHHGRPKRAVIGIPPLPTMTRSQSEA